MAVADDHWPPGTDVVHKGVVIFVEYMAAGSLFDKERVSADRFEGPDRTVDAAGDGCLSLLKQLAGTDVIHDIDSLVQDNEEIRSGRDIFGSIQEIAMSIIEDIS
jgi:hypothetical protein